MKGNNNTRMTKKYKSDISADTTRLEPMNAMQDAYIKAIRNDSMVLCTGVLGSSKTFIPAVLAAELMVTKVVDKIVIARPTEGKGKSVGYFKGTKDEKMSGWCTPITDTLKQRLGIGNFEAFVENGKIEMLALEQIKGRSWDDTFILVDEAEDLDPDVAKSLVTRIGVRSKLVVTGDIAQQDLLAYSGLQRLIDVAKYGKIAITHINFNSWDHCVRSAEAKAWGQAFEKYEKRGKK